jgi:hypothetical protein
MWVPCTNRGYTDVIRLSSLYARKELSAAGDRDCTGKVGTGRVGVTAGLGEGAAELGDARAVGLGAGELRVGVADGLGWWWRWVSTGLGLIAGCVYTPGTEARGAIDGGAVTVRVLGLTLTTGVGEANGTTTSVVCTPMIAFVAAAARANETTSTMTANHILCCEYAAQKYSRSRFTCDHLI